MDPELLTQLSLNVRVAWLAMAIGALSGAIIGLFFHQAHWLGGYNSFPRRLLRLGHIACFGIAFINIHFALSVSILNLNDSQIKLCSLSFIIAQVSMPLCCFVCAYWKKARHLFIIPVVSLSLGIASLIL